MKQLLHLIIWLIALAFAWAASHDIASGEADAWLEWSFLLVAAGLAAWKLTTRAIRLL